MSILSGSKEVWVVIVEWDGAKPPTTFYRRLDALTGKGQGHPVGKWTEAEKAASSVIDRRYGDSSISHEVDYKPGSRVRVGGLEQGVVIQEGCIICPSKSLAEYIAHYIKFYIGPDLAYRGEPTPIVAVGKWQMSTEIPNSPEVVAMVEAVESKLGARGRKPKASQWTTTCLECLEATEIKASRVVGCPSCNGLRVHARKGSAVTWADDGSPIVELWQRTRFFGPHMETAAVEAEGETAPALDQLLIGSATEEAAVKLIAKDKAFAAKLEKMGRDDALRVLDAIAVARAHYSAEQRRDARISAFNAYTIRLAEAGAMPQGLAMIEMPRLDFLDTALLLGVAEAVELEVAFGGSALTLG